ncbi:DUF2637 domain-containing protein [Streptomyces sp. NPDC005485]|uniref:DUF2637 domain-containing protein n=1 Tax=unclassified Streptomyces TaxID=2593676 RepID=UPI0033A9F56D
MSRLETLTPAQIQSAERVLSAGTWAITAGAILFSVLTVTPLVERVTPEGWENTAPILPLVVDAAVVIVVRLDATVDRLRTTAGRWPAVLRWLTGLMTLLLNVGDSALKGDATGVAVHAVAPLLLIVTAEAARSYRAAIGRALDEIERSRAEQAAAAKAEREAREAQQRAAREAREARERADREAREARERADRESAEARRESAEREARESAERIERERLDREERQAREERAHALQLEQQRAERDAAERREQREQQQARELAELEQRARAEREQAEQVTAEREARERAAAERRAAREKAATGSTPRESAPREKAARESDRLDEQAAREYVATAVKERPSVTLKELADATGWSIGWLSARRQELQTAGAEQ